MWLHTYLSEIHIRGLGRHRGVRLGHHLLGRGHLQHAQVCQGAPGIWRHLQRCRLLRWGHLLRSDDLRRSACSKFMDLHHICYVIRNGSWWQGRMSGRQWRPSGHEGHRCGHWILAYWGGQLRMWVTCVVTILEMYQTPSYRRVCCSQLLRRLRWVLQLHGVGGDSVWSDSVMRVRPLNTLK